MHKRLIFLLLTSTVVQISLGAQVEGLVETALQVERWLDSLKMETDEGLAWPVDPSNPQPVTNLYSGTPGVVLFYLELYRSTGDPSHLQTARRGAGYLLHHLPSADQEFDCGLYTGVAGIGFTLIETARLTGDQDLWNGARRAVRLLEAAARRDASGTYWNESTDIISGSAGIDLFLIYAAEQLPEPGLLDLAASSGRRLIAQARPASTGTKWAMSDDFPRLMPNFSHGTAGIAYVLAELFEKTHEQAFLDSALEGARYLLSVASTEGGVCLVFHHEPEGEDLYYLGWCHGPVGTGRLFYELHQLTADKTWEKALRDSAQAILQSGIPEKRTPGFWNNVGQCCGSAGVAEFFIDLARALGEPDFSNMAERMAREVIEKASIEAMSAKWVQAEHRVQPELLVAQTGFMQGASGIGIMLLHLDAFQKGMSRGILFPDSPFPHH